MAMNWNVIMSSIFVVIVPGFAVGLVPHWVLPPGASPALPAGMLGLVPLAFGLSVLLWCVLDFATAGQGTPAPIDPPKRLVTRGLYRYVRNPMYCGAALILVGEAILFASWALLIYAGVFCSCAHLFILVYEEPTLRKKFGASYEEFLSTVPRWIPRRPAD